MAYASLQDLTDRLGESLLVSLTDRAEIATGEIDEGVTSRALADAQAEIDGYLKGRYALPLADTPPLVADLALTIAVWKLHRFDPPQKVRDDYQEARRTLRDIAAGTVRLPVASAEPAGSGGSGVTITDRERPLSEKNLKGFI